MADYGGIGKAVDFMRQERAEAEELLAVGLERFTNNFQNLEIKETEDYLQLLKKTKNGRIFGFRR